MPILSKEDTNYLKEMRAAGVDSMYLKKTLEALDVITAALVKIKKHEANLARGRVFTLNIACDALRETYGEEI